MLAVALLVSMSQWPLFSSQNRIFRSHFSLKKISSYFWKLCCIYSDYFWLIVNWLVKKKQHWNKKAAHNTYILISWFSLNGSPFWTLEAIYFNQFKRLSSSWQITWGDYSVTISKFLLKLFIHIFMYLFV